MKIPTTTRIHTMFRRCLLVLLPCLLLAPLLASACNVRDEDEVVKVVEKPIKINYADGSVDRFVYVFRAHFNGCMNQSGRASHLFDHPIDDRACFYSTGSSITREGFFVTAGGLRASFGGVHKLYSNPIRRTDFGSPFFGHSTCGDHFAAYDKLKGAIKLQLIDTMDTLLNNEILPDALKDGASAVNGKLTVVQ